MNGYEFAKLLDELRAIRDLMQENNTILRTVLRDVFDVLNDRGGVSPSGKERP